MTSKRDRELARLRAERRAAKQAAEQARVRRRNRLLIAFGTSLLIAAAILAVAL